MLSNAVIPNNDSALLPLDTDVEVGPIGNVVIQEFEQRIRLFLLQTFDISRDCVVFHMLGYLGSLQGTAVRLTLWVHVNGLLTRGWVSPNNRMGVCNWLAPLDTPLGYGAIYLLNAGVHCL